MASSIGDELERFLTSIYGTKLNSMRRGGRPFVTLTYAQSLDGMIAGKDNVQIMLSGEASMRLTHRLRELHDAILVGVGTVISDDPQLTARLPDLLPITSQPQPVILDSHLRTATNIKLITNSKRNPPVTKPPIIYHTSPESISIAPLTAAGATLQYIPAISTDRLPLDKVLDHLGSLGHRSLMVEGGASIISAFLSSGLVDLVVITIAPVLIGNGIGLFRDDMTLPGLEHLESIVLGQDVVVVCRPVPKDKGF